MGMSFVKTTLQFQFPFGFHDVFDNKFRGCLASWEGFDGFDHFSIRSPLVFEILGATVIDVVDLGNLIQSIDARIPTRQAFFQMRPRTHVLISRPMKFHTRLAQPFLHLETPSCLAFRPGGCPRRSPRPRSPTRELSGVVCLP